MDWCLIAKIVVTIIGAVVLGYVGGILANITGFLIGLLGGAALVFFWLSTYILFFC